MKVSSSLDRRSSGVLLHVTSLPGPYGIGDLGPEALAWIDRLAEAKQGWWQILPLGPPGSGNSPYQCFSAFAGNPALISPFDLIKDGLLRRADCAGHHFPKSKVDYGRVTRFKAGVLALAWERFQGGTAHRQRAEYDRFCKEESAWLDGFSIFMAIKEANPLKDWTAWNPDLVHRKPAALAAAKRDLADAIDRHRFTQFLFYRQWTALRRYAKSKGVKLIGDLPIFVSGDSADVWSHADQFLLDRRQQPKVVAGVPPDYFSTTGQRWGNPLYDWRAMQKDRYAWWVARAKASLAQTDLVRIDHFRGFAAAWHVRADEPTAQRGKWVKGPGAELFRTFEQKLGGLPFIAEDLGVITPDVEKLRDDFRLPGMRVLQFAFGGGAANPFLPHQYPRNTIAYTGTHDNDTSAGWYATLGKSERAALAAYAPDADRNPAATLIRLAWSSVADCAIAPLQDVLSLGSDSRMNTPGTVTHNWAWRVTPKQLKQKAFDRLGEMTETYGRDV